MARLQHTPLLKIQRDLLDVPRGYERFQVYLNTLTGAADGVARPIGQFNPMSREHVAARLDQLLGMGAEDAAAEAVAEASSRLSDLPGEYTMGLVVADDVAGGWTNRFTTDAMYRFPQPRRSEWRYGVATLLLWVSDEPDLAAIRGGILAAAYRAVYWSLFGTADTLAGRLRQEGLAAVFAGWPVFNEGWRASRAVIEASLESTDYPRVFTCLYGDEAAARVGYPQLGVVPWAGFGFAAQWVRAQGLDPLGVLRDAGEVTSAGA
ncbi:MAG: hypothetical protein U0821_20690 [Chloroflexota bacterium]